jgi:hypothetical protein
MKKYSVKITHASDEYLWNLYEKQTNQVIGTFFFEDDAIEKAQIMEKGGGFDGYTPAFMLIPIPAIGNKSLVEDVNQRFKRTFFL